MDGNNDKNNNSSSSLGTSIFYLLKFSAARQVLFVSHPPLREGAASWLQQDHEPPMPALLLKQGSNSWLN